MNWRGVFSILTAIICFAIGFLLVSQLRFSSTAPGEEISGLAGMALTAEHAKSRLVKSLGSDTPVNTAAIQALAVREPLDALPYIAMLPEALANSDHEAVQHLSTRILYRAPRNKLAWKARLTLAARQGDAEGAIAALDRLYLLDSPQRETYDGILADIGLSAQGRQAFLDAIAKRPTWGRTTSLKIMAQSDDNDLLLALARAFPENQSTFLEKLTDQGNWAGAHFAFQSFVGPDARSTATAPFDPSFLGLSAPRPFNWLYNPTHTRLEARGGLSASFPGRSRVWLARQAISLPPGPHSLSAAMSGHMSPEGGYFRWEVSCIDGSRIDYLNVKDLLPVRHTYTTSFSIPADAPCDFQYLALFGMGGAFPTSARTIVHEVGITPAIDRGVP